MKALYSIVIGLLLTYAAKGQPKYSVREIPENLKTGMYAVVRDETTVFEILATNKTEMTHRLVVTILNRKGEDNAKMGVWYDPFRTIEYFRTNIYDENGGLIRKLKSSEYEDYSSVAGYSLFEDNRVRLATAAQQTFPYTVEFEYKVRMSYLYQIPDFFLYRDDEISIQHKEFEIVYALPALQPKYKLFKIGNPTLRSIGGGVQSDRWTFDNIIPEKFEKYGAKTSSIIPHILTQPTFFQFGGYSGKMDTWENLGKWQISLNQGRDVLNASTIAKVKEITEKYNTRKEKVKAVYEFLQGKTRYVNISLGIGGWQPFPAATVDQMGYGDCKGLSNYTVAMLKSIGINAYYSWIYGGDEGYEPPSEDFVTDNFNHIVVAVPNEADTLWLECTSQTNPFGYMGRFTGNRKSLMITEKGGTLVNTPRYPDAGNVISRRAEVRIDVTGNATATIHTNYEGLEYEYSDLNHYLNLGTDQQRKWIERTTRIPSFDIAAFSMVDHKSQHPSAEVNLDLVLNRLGQISGKRLFLSPNLMNRSVFMPEKTESRKTPIVIDMGYEFRDTVVYNVPEELYPEFIPQGKKLSSRFGEYETSYKLDQGKFIYIRKFRITSGEFPAEAYNEWMEFYKTINKGDGEKLAFLSKT